MAHPVRAVPLAVATELVDGHRLLDNREIVGMKRYRAKNYSCRGQKCANQPQLSIATSEELKDAVVKHTQSISVSVSCWMRGLMERELTRHGTENQKNKGETDNE